MTILALAIIAIGWLGYSALHSSGWVSHSIEAQNVAERLLRELVDAETGQRGFLLTGDEKFLAPYNDARKTIDASFAQLNALVADNPGQVAKLGQIRASASDRLATLEAGIGLEKAGKHGDAVDILRLGTGKQQMDQVRAGVAAFETDENQLLAVRRTDLDNQQFFSLLAMAALLAVMAALVASEALHARHLTRELADENARLDLMVAERTRDLEREKLRVQAFLADVNHRVGNTLNMASALINLQARRSPDENVKQALEDSVSRIRAIAASQRRLQVDADSDTVTAGPYIDNFLADIRPLAETRGIRIETEVGDIRLPGKDAVSYVLLINELVVNALKHAFPDSGGTVKVSLHRIVGEDGAPKLRLSVADDGKGMEGGSTGLGSSVTQLLTRSLGGTLETAAAHRGAPRPGVITTLTLPWG
ncbi:sensor histidine kinase [Aestuariivirga sp.]|uniref:sensor histidine kinase n=1 Tax=Aestuariivirga sp. TaxID=2650926 RepID=UPI0039E721FE